jgi:hypothetical protein
MTTSTKPATWFWVVSVIALLWNLMGVMAYVMHVTMTPEALNALPAQERALYTDVPLWATAAFAVAVWGSTLGCILLLIRRKLATPVFVISFIAILLQMIHSVFISNSIAVYGPGGLVMPIMVLVIGLYLIVFSRQAASKGWLR